MAIPSVKQFSQEPGGGLVTAMRGMNALTKENLENAFYAPNMQSNIDYRNALTNRSNTMLPLDANYQAQVNKLYAPNMQSQISNRNALTKRYEMMTPLEAEELRLKNKFYPELTKSDIDSKNALANWRNSGGSGLGVGGKEQMFYQNSVARDNPHLKTPEQIYEAANVLAQGGDTLSDGTKLNPLSPAARASLDRITKYGTTSQLINDAVKSNKAEAELEVLNNYAQEGLKPYGSAILGYSPEQVQDSFKSDDKSQKRLGKFIASQALQYEIAQNRIRLANGQPGVSSTEELMALSGQMIKSNYPKLSYTARKEASRYMDEALKEGLKARNSVGLSPSNVNSRNNDSNTNPKKITKEHINEENIQETMKQTGLTREQVMKELKDRGLI